MIGKDESLAICAASRRAHYKFGKHVGGLFLVLLLSACGSDVDLVSGVSESEANEVLSVLLEASLSATKIPGKENTASIAVPHGQVGKALQLLKSRGLPSERYDGMGQVFRKDGLISSPLEERARYVYALSQELSGTISKIDGVLSARVHVVLPEQGVAGDPGVPSTAAVFIKHRSGYNLEVVQPQIRRLVTNSIPGLTAERVSVVFVASQANRAPEAAPSEKPPMQTVLGFHVAEESATGLTVLVWGLIVALLAAIGGIFFARGSGSSSGQEDEGLKSSAPSVRENPLED